MGLYYSPQTGGWYDTDFAEYNLPNDALELTKTEWDRLRKSMNTGKKLDFVEDSLVWVGDDSTPTEREFSELRERGWRDLELSRADVELYKVQDSDTKAQGTVSQWREYRKALRSWPEHAAFPDSGSRPIAPDNK